MPRRKMKIHEDVIENWHLDDKEPGSREYNLLYGIAEEEEFNDIYASSIVTDDLDLLCFAIG